MFEKIKGIKIKSSVFGESTNLDLFDGTFENRQGSKNDRASLLFGRNGSGKSTLARGVNQIKTGNGDADLVSFIDKDNQSVLLNDDHKNSIFIFDENYIDSKVKISQDGLDTIVIFGKQNDIDSQIKDKQKQLNSIRGEYDQLRLEIKKNNDDNDDNSPEYWKKKISDSLKGTGNWAERDRELKGNRSATPVHADTFQQFVNLSPVKSKVELDNLFKEKKKKYFSLKYNSTPINNKLEHIEIKLDYDQVSELLSKKIEEPELTSRDKYLLELLSDSRRGEQHLKEVSIFFSQEDKRICPYCTQNISNETKDELIKGISKLLSKAVEEHQRELRFKKIPSVKLDFSEYNQLSGGLIASCEKSIEILNRKIEDLNSDIEQKINNPYRPVKIQKKNFCNELSLVNSNINIINNAVEEYNKDILDISKLKEELFSINNEIAYYEIQDNHKKYLEKTKQKEKCEKKYLESKKDLDILNQEIIALNNQKQNIDIAVDEINRGLSYIFFSNERLSLENRDGKYFLLSRGKSVKPNKVSVGERNALALSYFFTEIIQGKELANAYNQEYFFVLDDPVSSFDLENKIGIISYLKFCLNKFLSGNKNTRVLLTTHDVQTLYDFDKFLQEIMDNCTEKEKLTSYYKRLELFNGKLREYKIKSSHGYTELLEKVYDYATSTINEGEIGVVDNYVGNAMRKILEAYGSFTYKKGITQLTTDMNTIKKIEEKYRAHFENLMYRLVLHSESHYEDSVKALNLDFFSSISDTERQTTARHLLVLLYLFDDLHVLTHLQGKGRLNVKTQLEKWKSDIA